MSGRAAAVVAGAGQKGLNAAVRAFHRATRSGCPGPFQGVVEIETLGVKQVFWAIPNAPTIDLAPKQVDRDWLKARIRDGLGSFDLAEAWADSIVDQSVILAVEATGVEVTIEVDNGSRQMVSGKLSTFVQARASADRRIVFQAQHSRFVPDGDHDAGTQWLLDHIVVPQAQIHLNAVFADGNPFTPFPDHLVRFSAPSIAIADGALVAFATDDPTAKTAGPPVLSWPAGRVQEVARLDIWKRAFTTIIKRRHLGDSFEFRFDIPPYAFGVSYHWGIHEAQVVKRLSGDRLVMEMSAGGGGSVTVTILFMPAKLKLGIAARPQMEVSVHTKGGQIVPRIERINSLNLHLELTVPIVLQPILNLIVNAITKVVSGRMTRLLEKIDLGSTEIPSIDLGWGGVMASVSGKDLKLVQQSVSKQSTWFGMSAVPIATPCAAPLDPTTKDSP